LIYRLIKTKAITKIAEYIKLYVIKKKIAGKLRESKLVMSDECGIGKRLCGMSVGEGTDG